MASRRPAGALRLRRLPGLHHRSWVTAGVCMGSRRGEEEAGDETGKQNLHGTIEKDNAGGWAATDFTPSPASPPLSIGVSGRLLKTAGNPLVSVWPARSLCRRCAATHCHSPFPAAASVSYEVTWLGPPAPEDRDRFLLSARASLAASPAPGAPRRTAPARSHAAGAGPSASRTPGARSRPRSSRRARA